MHNVSGFISGSINPFTSGSYGAPASGMIGSGVVGSGACSGFNSGSQLRPWWENRPGCASLFVTACLLYGQLNEIVHFDIQPHIEAPGIHVFGSGQQ